jgi:hypothetical protein
MFKKLAPLVIIIGISIMAFAPALTIASTPEAPAVSCPTIELVGPADDFNPGGSEYHPTFSWSWDGQLKDNEYFDLRMWPEGSDNHWLGVMDYRATPRQPNANGEYVVTTSIAQEGDRDRFPGFYLWSVAVISVQPDGTVQEVCPEAKPHRLIYAPQSGPPPTPRLEV